MPARAVNQMPVLEQSVEESGRSWPPFDDDDALQLLEPLEFN